MVDLAKVRLLLETIRAIATHLTEEEISDIGLVLHRAVERIEKEQS